MILSVKRSTRCIGIRIRRNSCKVARFAVVDSRCGIISGMKVLVKVLYYAKVYR